MLYHDKSLFVAFGDNLLDVEQWLRATPRRWTYNSAQSNSSMQTWDLGVGYDGAVKMARDGWHEGAQMMHAGLSAMPAPVTKHAKLMYDVGGQYADVPRYTSGLPDNMVTRGKRKGAAPVVHIVVNGTCSSGTSSRQYLNYGLAVAALVDKLEASGRRVELDVVFCNSFRGKGYGVFGWKVKCAGDALDLSAVAYSLAHPAAYRRIGFAMWERTPSRWQSPGYGTCANINLAAAAAIGAENALLFDGIGEAISNCATPERALAFIVEKTNRLAGEELVSLT